MSEKEFQSKRTRGPSLPTLILRDAYLLAAKIAGGGGNDGLVTYLVRQAEEHPVAFLAGLNRIIPMQVEARGSAPITIEIVDSFGDDRPGPKLINGHVNGSNGHANGAEDTASE